MIEHTFRTGCPFLTVCDIQHKRERGLLAEADASHSVSIHICAQHDIDSGTELDLYEFSGSVQTPPNKEE